MGQNMDFHAERRVELNGAQQEAKNKQQFVSSSKCRLQFVSKGCSSYKTEEEAPVCCTTGKVKGKN